MSAVGLWEEQRCCLLYKPGHWPGYWSIALQGTRETRSSLCPPHTASLLPLLPGSCHSGSTCAFQALLRSFSNEPCFHFAPESEICSHGHRSSSWLHRKEEHPAGSVHLSNCRTIVHLCHMCWTSWSHLHIPHFCAAAALSNAQAERFWDLPEVGCILHSCQFWAASHRTYICMYLNSKHSNEVWEMVIPILK